MIILSNDYITAKISDHGAELCSLLHNGFEYIWQADPKYWGRHAPILFPIVGKVFNNEYHIEGQTYTLPQHGFARDMDFQPIDANDSEATFLLRSNEDTLKLYPYKFELCVKYTLSDHQLTVDYTVCNTDDKEIFFQIGGHPAFNYPNWPFQRGYLQLLKDNEPLSEISVKHPNSSGCISDCIQRFELSNGTISIKADTFDMGALILEDKQCDTIRMMNGNGTTHIEIVSKDAKLFGIWSPEHKNAPFVCIEPWLGRADTEGYNGFFFNRPYTNQLKSGNQLQFDYTIKI